MPQNAELFSGLGVGVVASLVAVQLAAGETSRGASALLSVAK
jgi:hypothetical protein